MNVVFMGTPDFAATILKKLIDEKINVTAVFTNKDKPVGRKQILTPPPVKILAEQNNIKVYQPQTLRNNKEDLETLKNLAPDYIVVAAYGKILPREYLEIPKYGAINVHGSLLPKYRGASPIQSAILNGENKTGITTMLMNEGMDTGDILLQGEMTIEQDDNSKTLFLKMAKLGSELIIETLKKLASGEIKPIAQNESAGTHCGMITKEMARLDFTNTNQMVYNKIRAFCEWPVAFFLMDGKKIKVYSASIGDNAGECSSVISVTDGIEIACGSGSILFNEIQPENGKRMKSVDFLRGHPVEIGRVIKN